MVKKCIWQAEPLPEQVSLTTRNSSAVPTKLYSFVGMVRRVQALLGYFDSCTEIV